MIYFRILSLSIFLVGFSTLFAGFSGCDDGSVDAALQNENSLSGQYVLNTTKSPASYITVAYDNGKFVRHYLDKNTDRKLFETYDKPNPSFTDLITVTADDTLFKCGENSCGSDPEHAIKVSITGPSEKVSDVNPIAVSSRDYENSIPTFHDYGSYSVIEPKPCSAKDPCRESYLAEHHHYANKFSNGSYFEKLSYELGMNGKVFLIDFSHLIQRESEKKQDPNDTLWDARIDSVADKLKRSNNNVYSVFGFDRIIAILIARGVMTPEQLKEPTVQAIYFRYTSFYEKVKPQFFVTPESN